MSHGIRRKPYQVLPESGARVTCVEINDHVFSTINWWEQTLESWPYRPQLLEPYRSKRERFSQGLGFRSRCSANQCA